MVDQIFTYRKNTIHKAHEVFVEQGMRNLLIQFCIVSEASPVLHILSNNRKTKDARKHSVVDQFQKRAIGRIIEHDVQLVSQAELQQQNELIHSSCEV